MCNHYRNEIRKTGAEFEEYGHEEFSETRIKIRFPHLDEEVFPDREALVARLDRLGNLVPDVMRWGFPPAEKSLVTNVRNVKSQFWKGWLKPDWRCLVPATAFSEWEPGVKKIERWFVRADERPFCFAGIWRPWTGARGPKSKPIDGEHRVFAFLTTAPNAIVRPIHPKAMPVLLDANQWDQWLTGSEEEALALQQPLPDEELKLVA
ncbi:MAG: SOS response-associated peptidase family protein [Hyphomonadaceae bacterium]|nr:SOS response-associated peptidase family protein [Hyphomonadaceae bacterium]